MCGTKEGVIRGEGTGTVDLSWGGPLLVLCQQNGEHIKVQNGY